jgi:hypothetical protein
MREVDHEACLIAARLMQQQYISQLSGSPVFLDLYEMAKGPPAKRPSAAATGFVAKRNAFGRVRFLQLLPNSHLPLTIPRSRTSCTPCRRRPHPLHINPCERACAAPTISESSPLRVVRADIPSIPAMPESPSILCASTAECSQKRPPTEIVNDWLVTTNSCGEPANEDGSGTGATLFVQP